jgi:hypothetical protein
MERLADDIKAEKSAHAWSGLFATWRLCDNAACRRARACRGEVRACLKAKFPLLPERVRDWFMGFLWHKQERFPFEDMIDNLESSGHGQALRDWREDGVREEEIEAARVPHAMQRVSGAAQMRDPG